MKRCTIDGCEDKIHASGLCNKHRLRLRTHGNPLTTTMREQGQGTIHKSGYCRFKINGRLIFRHILIAEKALGNRLPLRAKVHHIDENRSNDAPRNLVICENQAYHQLLHRRQRALRDCGHATWRSCNVCHRYDDPVNIYISPSGRSVFHATCQRAYASAWRLNRRTREQEKGLS